MAQQVSSPNRITIVGDHIEVDIGDGFTALFDLEDKEKIVPYLWTAHHNGNSRCPFGCRKHIYPINIYTTNKAHNLVMDFIPSKGYSIDHINKDMLDNRKCNLRVASRTTQSINQSLQRNSTTGRAGVSKYKNGMYAANWYENGKKVRKYFKDMDKAVQARLEAQRRVPTMLRHYTITELSLPS
jgi:hypothetical protein